MKTESVAGVQPSVMRWARESIGMSIEDVALKLKRSPEEVMTWEAPNGASPTYAQLPAGCKAFNSCAGVSSTKNSGHFAS